MALKEKLREGRIVIYLGLLRREHQGAYSFLRMMVKDPELPVPTELKGVLQDHLIILPDGSLNPLVRAKIPVRS